MSRNYPDRVRPEKVAAAKRTFSGSMPLRALKRAAEFLDEPGVDDALSFTVAFDQDVHGQIVADIVVEGSVPLRCQRTLDRFHYPINTQSRIGIASDEDAAERMPDGYEPKVCEGEDLALLDLVEEELLLALPLVPRKPGSEPVVQAKTSTDLQKKGPTHRPFSVLGDWKKKESENQ